MEGAEIDGFIDTAGEYGRDFIGTEAEGNYEAFFREGDFELQPMENKFEVKDIKTGEEFDLSNEEQREEVKLTMQERISTPEQQYKAIGEASGAEPKNIDAALQPETQAKSVNNVTDKFPETKDATTVKEATDKMTPEQKEAWNKWARDKLGTLMWVGLIGGGIAVFLDFWGKSMSGCFIVDNETGSAFKVSDSTGDCDCSHYKARCGYYCHVTEEQKKTWDCDKAAPESCNCPDEKTRTRYTLEVRKCDIACAAAHVAGIAGKIIDDAGNLVDGAAKGLTGITKYLIIGGAIALGLFVLVFIFKMASKKD